MTRPPWSEESPLLSNKNTPHEQSFPAEIIGVDIIGFSRFAEDLIFNKGGGSAEELTQLLHLGFAAVVEYLSPHQFTVADTLGDGLLLYRRISPESTPAPAQSISTLIAGTRRAFEKTLPNLRLRAASATGDLTFQRVGGWGNHWDRLVTGPVITQVHHHLLLEKKSERRVDPVWDNEVSPHRSGDHSFLALSEIKWASVLFINLANSQQASASTIASTQAAVLATQCLAEAHAGRLEKITHDDKGLLLRLTFDSTRRDGGNSLQSATDCAAELLEPLRDAGFNPRFGLADGLIYIGPITIDGNTLITIQGPAANKAAKLAQGTGEALRIFTSSHRELAEHLSTAGYSYHMEAGLDGALLVVDLAATRKPPSSAVPQIKLIGRERERRRLNETLASLTPANNRIFVLEGPPGIGKSALLRAFQQDARKTATVLNAVANPKSVRDPFSAWRSMWEKLLAEIAGKEKSDQANWIYGTLAHAGVPASLRPICCDVLGPLLPETETSRVLTGPARQAAAENQILVLLGEAAKQNPIVFCIDDAQWMDRDSWRLLRRVANSIRHIMITLCVRANHRESTSVINEILSVEGARQLSLQGLDLDATKIILNSYQTGISGNKTITPEISEQIFLLSGGNPFYAEQLIRWFMSTDASSLDEGLRFSTNITPEYAHDLLNVVLNARLDGLTADETMILRISSIMDQAISPETLAAMAKRLGLSDDLGARLVGLVDSAFIARDGAGEDLFTVKHRLLADIIIARTPPSSRRLMHRAAARVLSHLGASSIGETSQASLAYHWREAESMGRAAILFERSANAALYQGAYQTAANLFTETLALLNNAGVESYNHRNAHMAGWLAGRAAAFWGLGEIEQATRDADESLAHIDGLIGGPRRLPQGVRKNFARLRRTVLSFPVLSSRILPVFIRKPLIETSNVRSETGYFLGDTRVIASASLTTLALARDSGIRALTRARSLSFLGYAAGLARLPFLAKALFHTGRRMGDPQQDGRPTGHIFTATAVWHISFGRWEKTRWNLARAIEGEDKANDPHLHEIAQTLLALCAYFEGNQQESFSIFQQLLRMAERRDNRMHQAWGHYGMAQSLLISHEFDEAEKYLRRSEAILESDWDRQSRLICIGLRARIHLGQKKYAAALDWASQGLRHAPKLSANNFSALEGFSAPAFVALNVLASPDASETDLLRARALVRPGMKELRRFARIFPIARPRLLLCTGLLAKANGQTDKALKIFLKGLALAEKMGMKQDVAHFKQQLGQQ